MRKVLKRLLSKLFIVSTIIILQMVWFFFLFYTASAGNHIFDVILKIAAFFLAMYIANRQMKTYIKLSWIFLILSLPIVGMPCYFFFGRPELTERTQRRMKKIVDAHATYRPANEKIEKELMNLSPNLRREIKKINTNNNDVEVIFHNGSSFVVQPCNDDAKLLAF